MKKMFVGIDRKTGRKIEVYARDTQEALRIAKKRYPRAKFQMFCIGGEFGAKAA